MQDSKIKRDDFSKAILNTDTEGLAAYKQRRSHLKKLAALEEDINTMKHDMQEIKQLIVQLINRG